jgi:hypothetical protein
MRGRTPVTALFSPQDFGRTFVGANLANNDFFVKIVDG